MSSLLQREWVEMELGDVSKSVFNELPLNQDKTDLKRSCLETASALQDTHLLQLLAETRDGLINSRLRSKIWPQLLGVAKRDLDTHSIHRDEDQVAKDVARSFVYYPEDKGELRERLSRVIVAVLRANPELRYYQGFHDIASIVVMVFEEDQEAMQFLDCLTRLHLRDHMLDTIDSSLSQLGVIGDLLNKLDPKFSRVISAVSPIYALPSILSLFAHTIENFEGVCYVWDFVFAERTMALPLYIYASVLVYYKEEILIKLEEESGSSFSSEDTYFNEDMPVDNNLDVLQSILTNVVSENLGSELEIFQILQNAVEYSQAFPIEGLPSFKSLSAYSVLRTTSTKGVCAEDVQALIAAQMAEDRARAEAKKLERRPRKRSSLDNLKDFLGLTRRNKNLQVSMFVKLSLTIGLLSFILHYYQYRLPGGINNALIVRFATFSNAVAGINFGKARDTVFGFL